LDTELIVKVQPFPGSFGRDLLGKVVIPLLARVVPDRL
jgi:hypothetical protein